MKIIIENDKESKQDVLVMADFLARIFDQWGVPATVLSENNDYFLMATKQRIRKLSESLEDSIQITTKVKSASFNWRDYLFFDENENQMMVKGTLITVNSIVSLVIEGWAWQDILKTHPELEEDDIKACLMYIAHVESEEDISLLVKVS